MQHPFIQPGGTILKRRRPFVTRESSPIPLTDLAMWLRADSGISVTDGAPVPVWIGRSGSPLTGSQTTSAKQPEFDAADSELNNKPSVGFLNDDWLTLGQPAALDWNPVTDNMTLYAVVDAAAGETGVLFSRALNVDRQYQFVFSGEKLVHRWGANSGTSTADVTGEPKILAIANSVAAGKANVRVNGGAAEGDVTPLFVDTDANVLIGARETTKGGAAAFVLDNTAIAEVIAYNALHTVAQMEQVIRQYLGPRYGITTTAVS